VADRYDAAWNAILGDPELARARQNLSTHELRTLIRHCAEAFAGALLREPEWQTDVDAAPRSGIAMFGHNGASIAVIYYVNGWVVSEPLGDQEIDERRPFRPVLWMHIPPVNLSG